MKKIIPAFFVLIPLLFLQRTVNAQAKKYPLFEHFTQASCSPCAMQNPFFEAVYDVNKTNVHHISYHTSWPGYDPMYDFNPTGSDGMVTYYNVTGVPDMFLDGSDLGSPANVTQEMIDDAIDPTSPIRVLVSEETVGSTRNVTIEVQSLDTVPAGTYVLKAMVAEHEIDYVTAPGTNGETVFPDVFRKALAGTNGVSFTPAATGSSVTVTYSYNIDPLWDPDQTYVLAWIQNTSTKEVLNSGATSDPYIETVNTSASVFHQSATSSAESFSGSINNLGASDENVTITLDASEPGDWNATFNYMGTDYTGTATTTATAASGEDITLNVTVGASPAIGEYTITIAFPDQPDWDPQVLHYYVISGVTDLIVNNLQNFGDGSVYGTWDWQPLYEAGLNAAGVTSYSATSHYTMKKGFENNAFGEVKNIYYNVAWTFPALVGDDQKLTQLENFLDNGGNLFISGQDIGWEEDYYSAEYPEAVNFYENYLHASFVNDVAPGATTFDAVADDPDFGSVASNTITQPYGTDNYYPDQIAVNGSEAFPIFAYDNNAAEVGGIRSETANYKTVYLGIGIEMLGDDDTRNALMTATYQYFSGTMTGVAYDQTVQDLLGKAFPDPASTSTTIPLHNAHDALLRITDITGQTVKEIQVKGGSSEYTLDVSDLQSGMYFYFLIQDGRSTGAQKLNVTK